MTELLYVAGAAGVIFLLAGATQAVSGFGGALVAVPLLALLVDPVAAVVATTAVGMVLTSVVAFRQRAEVDVGVVTHLSLAALLGLPVGLVALATLDARRLTLLVAVVLIVFVALLASGLRLPTGKGSRFVAGVLSGALLTSTGMNGPPVVILLNAGDRTPTRFRATLQAAFAVQDLVAVGGFLLIGAFDPRSLAISLAGVATMPLGWRCGDIVFRRLSPAAFRRVVLLGLTLTAMVAVFTATR